MITNAPQLCSTSALFALLLRQVQLPRQYYECIVGRQLAYLRSALYKLVQPSSVNVAHGGARTQALDKMLRHVLRPRLFSHTCNGATTNQALTPGAGRALRSILSSLSTTRNNSSHTTAQQVHLCLLPAADQQLVAWPEMKTVHDR